MLVTLFLNVLPTLYNVTRCITNFSRILSMKFEANPIYMKLFIRSIICNVNTF